MSKLVKAIGYCGTATKEQARQNHSVETQKKQIEEAAKRLNVEIVEWFERAGTGDSWDYSGQISAAKYCQSNPDVKYLFITRPDRLGRSLENFFFWNKAFKNLGVTIKMANAESLEDSPVESFMQQTLSVVGEFASRAHSEAVKRGLRRKKELETSMEK
jgi:DNA invertase Pin-like site-specific DNA recombinase